MIRTNRWKGGTDEEYATQHFGFGAQRVKIALRQMVEEKIRTGVCDMETYLLNSLDLNESDKEAIRSLCKKLLRLYSERAEPSLEVVDSEIERILTVPSNVLLPDDEVHEEEITDTEYDKLKQEVTALRNRVERAALMEALLTAEENDISALEKVYETAKQNMEIQDMMNNNLDKNDLKTIQSSAQLLCAQSALKDDGFLDELS
ncbi:protein MIS12 homolog [Cydia amplana]|uniref:protein MIS12 homolog n=1 Tax=Cydia amplana TaxID=1869771 RepID=UPI002FE559E0